METNNKHTAGEWKATGLEIRHANNSMILATVYPHLPLNQRREEAEANAKLIAAAPKLLEALITALEFIRDNESDLKGSRFDESIKESEAAIKQATN